MARSKHALWIGLIFVFSAAFAREYDAEYIPRRPWIMLVPLAASLVSSFLLWGLMWIAALISSREQPKFWANYRAFLGLFWLTAPLAWVYAIPVERFLEPGPAVYANYALLGLVAAWRVFLMIRVAQVFTGRTRFGAATLVLLFGDTALLLALMLSPWPVIEIMAGARRSEVQAAHLYVVQNGFCWAFLGWPLLAIFGLFGAGGASKQRMQRPHAHPPLRRPRFDAPANRSLWLLAAGSLLVWAPVLPFTQPPLVDEPGQYDLAMAYEDQRREWWNERTNGAGDSVVVRERETLRFTNRHGEIRVYGSSMQWRKLTWREEEFEFKAELVEDERLVYSGPAASADSLSYREGHRDFETVEDALAWVKSHESLPLSYTSKGLACGWEISEDGSAILIEIWQLTINGSTPADLPGASNADIDLLR